MKILWISNVLFPEVCKELQLPVPVVGGWMEAGAKSLLTNNIERISLAVATLYNGKDLKYIDSGNIKYYLIPNKVKYTKEYFKKIRSIFRPDLVHIHGTEYPHSLAYIDACGEKKVVVSIQGLVSRYSKYYLGGISKVELYPSLRDVIRFDSIFSQQRKMKLRGDMEIQVLSRVEHIIGRTSWDKSQVWAINPLANYYFCNETLRSTFYNLDWQYDNCDKYTIFLSQAHYPIKGLHQILKAIAIVVDHFPDVKVYVAGNDFFSCPFWKRNAFANYINRQMKKYNISDRFFFLGPLSEADMAKQFQKANVFICPSMIENSPNSVGEAQLIGTPCISSYVGGVMDMIIDGETGFLYRFEEVELLAFRICQLFNERELCMALSTKGKLAAKVRHDQTKNALQLLDIYKKILVV